MKEDNLIEVVKNNASDEVKKGDILFVSEKIVAITQAGQFL